MKNVEEKKKKAFYKKKSCYNKTECYLEKISQPKHYLRNTNCVQGITLISYLLTHQAVKRKLWLSAERLIKLTGSFFFFTEFIVNFSFAGQQKHRMIWFSVLSKEWKVTAIPASVSVTILWTCPGVENKIQQNKILEMSRGGGETWLQMQYF